MAAPALCSSTLFTRGAVRTFFFLFLTRKRGVWRMKTRLLDEVGEELEEEGDHEEADVHTVDIGISGDDDFIVAQSVKTVFDVECGL